MKTAIRLLVVSASMVSGIAAAQPYAEPAPPAAAPAPAPGYGPVYGPGYATAPVVAPAPKPERHGFFASGGLWGGEISCDGTDCGGFREAGGAGLSIGYLISPRFALLSDTWAMTSQKDSVGVTFVTSTIGARAWLTPAIWIQGGVGVGHAKVTWGPFTTDSSDDVPVASVGAGIELLEGRSWAIDLSVKVAQGTKTDNEGMAVTTGRQSGVGVSFVGFLQ